ncbi:cytosolic phospholipase A2 gamma-like isoform X2 [Megalobrama amblycephala]|uniref:cytosolic phospholipase A2 gamma-like isoform X2 n=1 Tax=Megalobrama amblycephala TaxID=75352 RepID=UPI00201462F1|nr:cytosolic phospholipase A2 gamma-like isoform X2 [Megalobrama amblycephala]
MFTCYIKLHSIQVLDWILGSRDKFCYWKMSASKPQESVEVRIEHSLNEKEKEFVAKRRKAVLESLQKLQIHCSQTEVPNIALLGSGGGQRAMVGLLGSLVQLQKTGLLDSILYLSGVSGSTWCMASLYQEPDWSTKLETVKDKIIQRLSGPGVSWTDAFDKLKKYYGKDIFSMTDVWAAMFVTNFVKEIDEHTLTDHWDQQSKDPFPIYAVIDKHCKQHKDGDPWFEITPHEAGYSLTGAFVDASSFGSKFENGCKIKDQPEIDMLYLQALCGSVLSDGVEILKFLWERIKEFLHFLLKRETGMFGEKSKDECYQVLMDLVDMNLSVLNDKDPSDLDVSIRTKLNELTGGKHQLIYQDKKLNLTDKEAAKQYMKQYTEDVCNDLSHCFCFRPFDILMRILICMALWIWGRNYNFLHNMKDEAVPSTLLESETRDYEDAGLLLNSPYFSVLRKERDINLIISLDFSDDLDPFTTVKEAAKMCKELNIPFPEVNIPSEDVKKPKDFYVFTGQNTPTVIHIPLFNVVNCGDDIEAWRNKYATFQHPYSTEMITDLMEVAGKNIINNKDKLLEQIRLAIGPKIH